MSGDDLQHFRNQKPRRINLVIAVLALAACLLLTSCIGGGYGYPGFGFGGGYSPFFGGYPGMWGWGEHPGWREHHFWGDHAMNHWHGNFFHDGGFGGFHDGGFGGFHGGGFHGGGFHGGGFHGGGHGH